jgi:hypothetical protein
MLQKFNIPYNYFYKSYSFREYGKSDWGTLVPRINVENGIKLGFLLQ